MKKLPKKNGWTLYQGLYSVLWKNDRAIAVEIQGVMLKIVPWVKPKKKNGTR